MLAEGDKRWQVMRRQLVFLAALYSERLILCKLKPELWGGAV